MIIVRINANAKIPVKEDTYPGLGRNEISDDGDKKEEKLINCTN